MSQPNSHQVQFESEGLPLAEGAEDLQQRYLFELECAPHEDWEFDALRRFLTAWYELGFYGAFGTHFSRISEIARGSRGDEEVVSFSIIGGVSEEALAVIGRVLGCPDHDTLVNKAKVTVSADD